MSKGWISLDRAIRDHWLYQEKRVFSRYEAWIDILMDTNHADNKFMMNGELIQVNRGSFITSIRKLGERWSWSRTKVKSFFELLESDGMVTVKSDTKKTLVTVEKYEDYQSYVMKKRHQKESEEPQESHGSATEVTQKDTNNNVNNANNSNNVNNGFELPSPTSNNNNINVYEEVEKNFGRPISPIERETISSWISEDKYSADVIQVALSEAVLNQAFSLKYMDRILLSWERKGVKTKSEALSLIQKRSERSASNREEQEIPKELPHVPLYNWVTPKKNGVSN